MKPTKLTFTVKHRPSPFQQNKLFIIINKIKYFFNLIIRNNYFRNTIFYSHISNIINTVYGPLFHAVSKAWTFSLPCPKFASLTLRPSAARCLFVNIYSKIPSKSTFKILTIAPVTTSNYKIKIFIHDSKNNGRYLCCISDGPVNNVLDYPNSCCNLDK